MYTAGAGDIFCAACAGDAGAPEAGAASGAVDILLLLLLQ